MRRLRLRKADAVILLVILLVAVVVTIIICFVGTIMVDRAPMAGLFHNPDIFQPASSTVGFVLTSSRVATVC
jgi:uncharacterized membrane protein (DUF106 family)